MNKRELVERTAEKSGLTKKDTESAMNAMLACIADELASSRKVQLVGFGGFSVKERAARTGLNPKTKESIAIPASRTVVFTVGKELKRKVNEKVM